MNDLEQRLAQIESTVASLSTVVLKIAARLNLLPETDGPITLSVLSANSTLKRKSLSEIFNDEAATRGLKSTPENL